MMRLVRAVVIAVAVIVGLYFGLLNKDAVTVQYGFGDLELPLVLVMVSVFVLGFLLSMILLLARITLLSGRLRRTRSRLEDAQSEIRNLRNMPIHDA